MLMLIAAESAPRLTAATIASDNKNQMLLKATLALTTKQAGGVTSWHTDADAEADADAKQEQPQQLEAAVKSQYATVVHYSSR